MKKIAVIMLILGMLAVTGCSLFKPSEPIPICGTPTKEAK